MRTKNSVLNFLADVFPQVIIIILGIVKSKYFLMLLGEQQLGIYQLYYQLFAYLAISEAGVGTASLYRLYKPVAEKDQNAIDTILLSTKKIFRAVTFIMLFLGVILAFFVPNIISNNIFSKQYIIFTFILYLFSQTIVYLIVPEKLMFDADQKRYIPTLVLQVTAIVKLVGEIILIFIVKNLYAIIISLLLINIISNLIMRFYFKKYYKPINKKANTDFSMIKDTKHLFINTLATMFNGSFQTVLIARVLGLSYVVIYTAYNYITKSLALFLEKITGAIMTGIADVLINEKKRAFALFLELNSLVFYLALVICIPLSYVINDFLNIWYEGNIVTSKILAILFSLTLFIQIIRIPLNTFTFAAGKFKLIKKYVIVETIINITVSIILIFKLKIAGLLIASIISFVCSDYFLKSRTIIKKILEDDCKIYQMKNLKYLLFAVISYFLVNIIYSPQSTIINWFLSSIGIFILNFIMVTILYFISNEKAFLERIKLLWKRLKK